MKKSELEAEIARLQEKLESSDLAIKHLIQGGLIYKRQFEEAYFFLKSITGLNSHPQWLELQTLLGKYKESDHPLARVVPRIAHQWSDTSTQCVCCGLVDE